jgi:hypothetical protein
MQLRCRTGDWIARFFVIFVLSFLAATSGSEARCVEPSMLEPSIGAIERRFAEHERTADSGIVGIRGTVWFLDPQLIAIAAHAVDAMRLSSQHWKNIEIRVADNRVSMHTHRSKLRKDCGS